MRPLEIYREVMRTVARRRAGACWPGAAAGIGCGMLEQRTAAWSAKVESAYRSLGREIWALLYAQCTDPERASDALQEAFARLQEQNGAPIRDVRAWLLHVGRNCLRDMARRQRVRAHSASNLDHVAGPQVEPSAVIEHEEMQAVVRESLSRLRSEDREVLVLRYAMGWSSQRIGETLEVGAAAIDMRLSRARRRLGELLEQAGLNEKAELSNADTDG